jgi:ech hydrogenase subunit E
LEVLQSIAIVKELVSKIPDGPISNKVKGSPAAGSAAVSRLEQPRGECFYYAKGNGSKFLERFRIRTPTAQNIAGMTVTLQGCDLADVPLNILTIDPCISCTER